MPSRAPSQDPFNDTSTPAVQSSGNSLRHQPFQQSLRSAASAAPARTRQQGDFLAPSLSRRPTCRITPVVAHQVRADTESASEQERERVAQRQRRLRGAVRQASPAEGKNPRLRPRQQQAEELDIVNRGPDGNYLLDGGIVPAAPAVSTDWDNRLKSEIEHETALARKYFVSGEHMKSHRPTRKHADFDDFELMRPGMVAALREEAMQKIEDERWLYEPEDRYQSAVR